MSIHKNLIDDDIHAVNARTYADVAARDSDTDFQVTANINKLVRVDSPISYFILASVDPTVWVTADSEGADEFIELIDTPSTYTGQAGLVTQVNTGETGLEFGQALDTTDSPTFAQVNVDNLRLDDNVLSSTDTNGNIILDPNGTGRVDSKANINILNNLNGYQIAQAFVLTETTLGSSVVNSSLTSVGTLTDLVVGTTVTPDGTVHIHTASAGAVQSSSQFNELVLENSGDSGLTILSPDANFAGMNMGSPGQQTAAAVRWKFSTNRLTLGTFNTGAEVRFVSGLGVTAMTIDGSQGISIGTTLPTTDASLDLVATDKAFMNNGGTTLERDALTPSRRMWWYNTDTDDQEFYNGTAWQSMGGGDVSGPGSSVDNGIATFNGTSGKNIQDTPLSIIGNILSATATDGDVNVQGNVLGKVNLGVELIPAVNWVDRTPASVKKWTGLVFGGGKFVAVASNSSGSDLAMVSPDGINWTLGSTPPEGGDTANWVAVAFGNNIYAAVSQNSTLDSVMSSPDGLTWTRRTQASNANWKGIAFGNGVFVTVSTTSAIMTSPDGINWTARSGINRQWRAITFGNGLFVAVANTGTGDRVQTSLDGITWTSRTSAEDNDWFAVTFGNNLFVAVSTSGTNRVMTSPDGITWTARSAAAAKDWRGVSFGGGQFVAVSIDSTDNVMTSPDGINWTTRQASSDSNWVAVAFRDDIFVAIGQISVSVMTSGTIENNLLRGGFDAVDGLKVEGSEAAVLDDNEVIISQDSEWPTYFLENTHYLITAPITVPAGKESVISSVGNVVIESTDRINNGVTYTGTTGTLFTATNMAGGLIINNVTLNGNANTTRLFNITGASGGFASITMDKVDIGNWGTVSELSTLGGGIAIGKISGSQNTDGVFNIVDSVFLGVENAFLLNFFDTGSNFFTIDALTARVAMTLTGVIAQPNERVFNVNSSFTGEVIINTVFGVEEGRLFDSAGLDGTSIFVDVANVNNNPDSTTSAELFLTGNTATTSIPAVGAMVEINVDVDWTDDSEQMTTGTDGVTTYIGLSALKMAYSGNINLEPSTASKSLSIRTVLIDSFVDLVTFTNSTNVVDDVTSLRTNGDTISFRDTAGTLPAEIRKDVVYFVINKTTNTFQISYTLGGSAITFTDDGTGTNSYKVATLQGATPTASITAANPEDLIPQATIPMSTNDKSFLVVINNDDAVDIVVDNGYQRYSS